MSNARSPRASCSMTIGTSGMGGAVYEVRLRGSDQLGSVYAGLAIYDTMQFIKPDVVTICFGMAMSMGSLLLAGGTEGKRFALPNSRILIHQPSGGYQGQSADVEIHAREIIDVRKRLDKILADHTGQDFEKVTRDTERDYFMSADEAKDYNLIDRVISQH